MRLEIGGRGLHDGWGRGGAWSRLGRPSKGQGRARQGCSSAEAAVGSSLEQWRRRSAAGVWVPVELLPWGRSTWGFGRLTATMQEALHAIQIKSAGRDAGHAQSSAAALAQCNGSRVTRAPPLQAPDVAADIPVLKQKQPM